MEHYVARESQTSLIGNVYLGRVQNVLPSMEAAFIDIGKGRNAVLYAGEVNWAASATRTASSARSSRCSPRARRSCVQVTKDPVGHKGARLTGQVEPARPVPRLRARTATPPASPASCPTPSATGSRPCSRRSSPTPPA